MTDLETTQELETTLPPGGEIPPVESPVTAGDAGTPTSKPNIPDSVPYDRFQEVNEEKKDLRLQNERLLTILQNQGAATHPAPAPIVQEETPDLLPMPTREAFTQDVDGFPEYDEAAHFTAIGETAQKNAVRMVKHEQKIETAKTETQIRAKQGQDLYKAIIETHPDFETLMNQSQPSTAVVEALFALDEDDRKVAAEASYFLAKNPNEMNRLNSLRPQAAIVAVGKLAAKLSLPNVNPKTVSDAPSPAGPIKTTETPTNFDPLSSTSKEYARHHPMADKLPWLKNQ